MRWILILLAVLGMVASALALREHYRTDASPCSINQRWDCGIVNKSPFAMMHGVPVAAIGIAGYLFLAFLAWRKAYAWMLPFVTAAFAFAIHL
ncbi:MAG: vitamin K epoxide reductase family protein, partial [Terriglobales bacterium]